jgi:hypothetical protein
MRSPSMLRGQMAVAACVPNPATAALGWDHVTVESTLENDTIAGLTKEAICRKKKATADGYGRGYKIWYNG